MTTPSNIPQLEAQPFTSAIPCAAMIDLPGFQAAGAWRDPENRTDWLRARFWTDIGQQLEADGYDMVFIADALAMARGHDGTTDAVISRGAKGGIYLDPVTVMSVVAGVTAQLRLGCTISTSFVLPYDIARRLATLHQLSGGRAAWNIVTSAYDAEAQNMQRPGLEPKEQRYRRAHSVTQEVIDIWQSFPDSSLFMDTTTGRFADPSTIRPTPQGVGPLTLPGDIRGYRPMLLQAGASPTGVDFAARWADATFMVAANGHQAHQIRSDLRTRAAQVGRNPDDITTLMAVQPIVAATQDAAEKKLQLIKEQIDPHSAWQDLAAVFRAAPDAWDLSTDASEFLRAHRGATGAEGFENIVAETVAAGASTIGELAVAGAIAQFKPIILGDPERVAQQMLALVGQGATDGYMITSTVTPGSFEDFAPVIQLLNKAGT